MKALSLNMIWELCIEMWEYVVEQMNTPWNTFSVDHYKAKWIKNHGFKGKSVNNCCFFCQYDGYYRDNCQNCPAKLVNKEFNCCGQLYHYEQHPTKFLAEVKRLNKIRLQEVTDV
jgi:hypothetical protein